MKNLIKNISNSQISFQQSFKRMAHNYLSSILPQLWLNMTLRLESEFIYNELFKTLVLCMFLF